MSRIQILPSASGFNLDEAELSVAHRLPCTVAHDGALPTARAFCAFPGPMDTFRGRQLGHCTASIPSSSHLVLAKRKKKEVDDEDHDDVVQIQQVLHPNIMVYEQDGAPADNAPVPAALRWANLAAQTHAATDPAALQRFLEAEDNKKEDEEVKENGDSDKEMVPTPAESK